jgi:hypothetical protein
MTAGTTEAQRLGRVFWFGFAALLLAQAWLGFWGVDDLWTRGHNGWNEAGTTPPRPSQLYTHHPLAMHLHNTTSMLIVGDRPAAVRGVAALHGVLAVLMCMLWVRRFWGEVHALLAGAIYVVLPINGIYLNMANHSSGFIFWSLLCLYCYLRYQERVEEGASAWKLYAGTLASFFMAAQWDWPAYYVAFGIAVHWLVRGVGRLRRAGRTWWRWDAHLFALTGFSVWVLALFGGHFFMVQLITENIGELTGTFHARQNVSLERFQRHLGVVAELMYTWPVLALSAAWLIGYVVRLFSRRARARDLVPLIFACGGAVHYWMFKWSAVVHCYWSWTMLPFVAIACASCLVTLGSSIARWTRPRLGAWGARACAAALGLLLVPLAVRAAEIVPAGRRVGGSMWWVAPVRGPVHDDYDSGRHELSFAEQVREWTDRRTGVLVHHSIERLRPEPRFNTHLDRERVNVRQLPPSGLPSRPGVDGWVLIGLTEALTSDRLGELAARHPYWQWGRFFMLDLRRQGPDVRVWDVHPQPRSALQRYFASPFERPLAGRRAPESERAILTRVSSR